MLNASHPKASWKLVHIELPLMVATVILTYTALPANGSFHFMQVEAVIGGIDGDTSAQAIELRMRAPGQNFLQSDAGGTHGPAVLKAWDANGSNPVTLIAFPNDVTNGATGDTVLIASPNFSNHVSPAFSGTGHADFTLTNLIPSSYLTAGRLTYEDNANDILWSLAWGGANYTGSTTGSPPAFNTLDAALNFGKFAGSLPTNGLQALTFLGAASAPSSAVQNSTTGGNATDYSLSAGPGVFTNNAHASFTVVPETSGFILGLFSLVGLLTYVWRRRR